MPLYLSELEAWRARAKERKEKSVTMRHKFNDKRLNEPSVLILACFFLARLLLLPRRRRPQIAMYIYLFFFVFSLFDEIQ